MTIGPYVRKANFYETDQMGVIHHSNYIRWFEEARCYYMEAMGYGYDRATEEHIDIMLTGLSCEYKSIVRYGETVSIELGLTQMTPTRITCVYTVRDRETGVLRATGETRHCYWHSEKKRPVSLKKELPDLFEIFTAYRDSTMPADAPEAPSI